MGNTSSNPSAPNTRVDSPSRNPHSPIRGGSPNPSSTSHRVHRSLRHRKRSLELPDLASLTLTPASSSPSSVSPHPAHRHPRASSPIPIPTSANPPPQTFRPQNNLPSAARIDRMRDGHSSSRYKSSLTAFNSTRSFQSVVPDSPPRNNLPLRQEFVPEVVHSTIPLALVKAEEDAHKPEPVNYKITWRGAGKKVYLIRAGHDNWQGRQQMEYDPQTETFWTVVPLLPGTHHFKFIVDDQIRLTNDYPRAVDDRDGTLANYVAVTAPPKMGSPQQLSPSQQLQHSHQNSFWSDSSTAVGGPAGKGKEAAWTTEIPPELIAAAAEEEAYLARADSPTSSGIPTPNIPPAPALPRHLDKLILNVRPVMAGPAIGGPPSSSSDRDKRRSMREKERSRRDRGRDTDSRSRPANLGMTSADLQSNVVEDGHARANGPAAPPPPLNLPVVTASGTDVTAMIAQQQASGPPTPPASQARPWDGPGVSDDASVLPVPSHVVLHHLSTSAIRNGVLAVANTTRYRKKYITTIYYKPT
ncbi:5'-AMP-activated protein kinase beta subunit, interation domain-containing protein [Trametes punicea]|nr:5'-AMP-activated protein kinase beta subunit, interation domain-containing protein [Trametes punicea]